MKKLETKLGKAQGNGDADLEKALRKEIKELKDSMKTADESHIQKMKDLEAKAKQLEKALLAETQAKVQEIMVDAMAGEFSAKELEELIHTEKLNIRVQGVAARLDQSLTELLG